MIIKNRFTMIAKRRDQSLPLLQLKVQEPGPLVVLQR